MSAQSTAAPAGRSPLVMLDPKLHQALTDIANGWKRRALWATMGLHDIRRRYRRSVLGPFWITLSMGIMVAALGFLYGTIFKQDMHEYLPYLAAGFVCWGLISGLFTEATAVFTGAEGLIRQLPAPLSVHVYRLLWSNLITFGHNIWVFFAAAAWYGVNPGWTILLAVPALLLVLLNGFWLGLLLGLLSARFRDIPLVVASVVQVLFFITPVIWRPDMVPDRAVILDLNPMYHFVEILRAPLLGQVPGLLHWVAAILITAAGWTVALGFFRAYRWRVAYWV